MTWPGLPVPTVTFRLDGGLAYASPYGTTEAVLYGNDGDGGDDPANHTYAASDIPDVLGSWGNWWDGPAWPFAELPLVPGAHCSMQRGAMMATVIPRPDDGNGLLSGVVGVSGSGYYHYGYQSIPQPQRSTAFELEFNRAAGGGPGGALYVTARICLVETGDPAPSSYPFPVAQIDGVPDDGSPLTCYMAWDYDTRTITLGVNGDTVSAIQGAWYLDTPAMAFYPLSSRLQYGDGVTRDALLWRSPLTPSAYRVISARMQAGASNRHTFGSDYP